MFKLKCFFLFYFQKYIYIKQFIQVYINICQSLTSTDSQFIFLFKENLNYEIALVLENPGKPIYFNYMELTQLTTLNLTFGHIMILEKMLSS